MSDKIDIYDDRGKLLESGVDLTAIAPTRNAAIQNIIKDTKRTVAVNLAGIDKALQEPVQWVDLKSRSSEENLTTIS